MLTLYTSYFKSLPKSNVSTLQISYLDFKALIWKVLPAKNGHLCLELRDGDLRKTMLALVNVEERALVYQLDKLPKPWWIGLKAVHDDSIVLQSYKDSKSPVPMGVFVLSFSTGELIWKNEQATFKGFDLDGRVMVEHEQENVTQEPFKEFTEEANNSLKFPLLHTEESTHYPIMAEFILDTFGHKCAGPIDYLELENSVVMAYYYAEKKSYTQLLAVVDEEGKILLHETLMKEGQGIGTASFFLVNTHLIFVKNKTQLGFASLT